MFMYGFFSFFLLFFFLSVLEVPMYVCLHEGVVIGDVDGVGFVGIFFLQTWFFYFLSFGFEWFVLFDTLI